MATVELRPGDTLNIIWKSVQDTPLGSQEIESNFEFSYDELVARLRGKPGAGKSRKSGTEGARFSRIVALSTNALKKGKWSTGAGIDRNEVFERLYGKFSSLMSDEYKNITGNAKEALAQIYDSGFLTKAQKELLKPLLDAASIRY
jgi:hypothetical protein